MLLDCTKFTPDQIYFLLVQTVIPRPIAWVLSDHGNGSYNLAPFSFFNAIASNPAVLMISVGWKDEQTRKDTWTNIEERHDFVVHIPSDDDIKPMVGSAITLPHGQSEIKHLDLKLDYIQGQRLPRVIGPKAAFFCKKFAIHEIGRDPQALILGEVTHMWIDDAVLQDKQGRLTIDAKSLNPIARLGGTEYTLLGNIFSVRRPD